MSPEDTKTATTPAPPVAPPEPKPAPPPAVLADGFPANLQRVIVKSGDDYLLDRIPAVQATLTGPWDYANQTVETESGVIGFLIQSNTLVDKKAKTITALTARAVVIIQF